MYQILEDQLVRSEDSTIPYTWIRSEQPNQSICIMLPGLGYSTQRPLFHFATGMCINHNIDVLHINYQFAKNDQFKMLSETEQDQWMYEDVKAVVGEVLKDASYDKYFIISKSIGTIPMALAWTQKNFPHDAIGIWLTPLMKDDNVYHALLTTDRPSLCVIGDKDHHYIEDRISSLKNNPLVSTVVIPDADHGLEIKGDTIASIEAIKAVIERVETFMIMPGKGGKQLPR